jgi:hypothetical protein
VEANLAEFRVCVERDDAAEVSSVNVLFDISGFALAELAVDLIVGIFDVVLHAFEELLADELVLKDVKPVLLPDEEALAILQCLVRVVRLLIEGDAVAPDWHVFKFDAEIRFLVDGVAHLVHVF